MSTTEPTETEVVQTDVNDDFVPAGEDIHLPGGSIIPLTTAVGITMTVIGTTIGKIWMVIGLIVFLVSLYKWIQDVRHDMAHLPDEHHH